MRGRRMTWTVSSSSAAVVAVLVVGSQLVANAGPQPSTPPPAAPAAVMPTTSADDNCHEGTPPECGSEHAIAVRAWVTCKAAKGKDACVKPTPPGWALGHGKHLGTRHQRADGDGHGGGRAHAPGQLKPKDKPPAGLGEDDPAD